MKKIKYIFVFLITSLFLVSCNDTNRSNSMEETIEIPNGILEFVSEEEQFEKSDLVILIKAHSYGEVVFIDKYFYTIYYFSILEFYKGDEEINHAYFVGNTTPTSTISSSVDEKLIKDENYKLYLRKKDNKYITTAGYQSIIKQ